MGPPHEGSIRWPIAPWANALITELHLVPIISRVFIPLGINNKLTGMHMWLYKSCHCVSWSHATVNSLTCICDCIKATTVCHSPCHCESTTASCCKGCDTSQPPGCGYRYISSKVPWLFHDLQVVAGDGESVLMELLGSISNRYVSPGIILTHSKIYHFMCYKQIKKMYLRSFGNLSQHANDFEL